MKLVVLGATGGTGLQVVRQALTNSATEVVTAIVRNPEKLPTDVKSKDKFKFTTASIFSANELSEAFQGHDTVISCLGYPGLKAPFTTMSFYSDSAKAMVEAVKTSTVKRLIVMSSWCTVYDRSHPIFVEWIFKPLMIGRHLDDMHRMEDYLESRKSEIEFICVRAPGLEDKPACVDKEFLVEEGQWIPKNTMGYRMGMSREDVARFLILCATDGGDKWVGKCIALGQ